MIFSAPGRPVGHAIRYVLRAAWRINTVIFLARFHCRQLRRFGLITERRKRLPLNGATSLAASRRGGNLVVNKSIYFVNAQHGGSCGSIIAAW